MTIAHPSPARRNGRTKRNTAVGLAATLLLTGASGLVGSRLLPRLVADGFDCRALVRGDVDLPAGATAVRGDLAELDGAPLVEPVGHAAPVQDTRFIDTVAAVMGRQMELDDRIVVLRGGRVVADVAAAGCTGEAILAAAMGAATGAVAGPAAGPVVGSRRPDRLEPA